MVRTIGASAVSTGAGCGSVGRSRSRGRRISSPRATGGPAERTFATLVGLELRPRRLREAAAIWRGLTDARGIAGREAIWTHPDLLPTTEDLDDPEGFVRGRPELDISDMEADSRALDETSAQGEPAPEDDQGTQDGDDSSGGDDHAAGDDPQPRD